MDLEDCNPPELVEVSEQHINTSSQSLNAVNAELEDLSIVKVPLTIVTGENLPADNSSRIDIKSCRLSWSWQNYFGQLYP